MSAFQIKSVKTKKKVGKAQKTEKSEQAQEEANDKGFTEFLEKSKIRISTIKKEKEKEEPTSSMKKELK